MNTTQTMTDEQKRLLISTLPEIHIFGAIGEDELLSVADRLEFAQHATGDVLFEQDSQPNNIYVLLSGEVRITARLPEHPDDRLEIAHITKGQCFGQVSVLGIQPRLGTAIVEQDVQLLVISQENLNALRKHNLAIFTLLLMNISRELCRRLNRITQDFLKASHTCSFNCPHHPNDPFDS